MIYIIGSARITTQLSVVASILIPHVESKAFHSGGVEVDKDRLESSDRYQYPKVPDSVRFPYVYHLYGISPALRLLGRAVISCLGRLGAVES